MIKINEAYKKIDYYSADKSIKSGDTVECNIDFIPDNNKPKIGDKFIMQNYNLVCTKIINSNKILARVISKKG